MSKLRNTVYQFVINLQLLSDHFIFPSWCHFGFSKKFPPLFLTIGICSDERMEEPIPCGGNYMCDNGTYCSDGWEVTITIIIITIVITIIIIIIKSPTEGIIC